MFELMTEKEIDEMQAEMPDGFNIDDLYGERCDECGGKVVATGGQSYYNGSYQCYTLYLDCENCGPYEVECV